MIYMCYSLLLYLIFLFLFLIIVRCRQQINKIKPIIKKPTSGIFSKTIIEKNGGSKFNTQLFLLVMANKQRNRWSNANKGK